MVFFNHFCRPLLFNKINVCSNATLELFRSEGYTLLIKVKAMFVNTHPAVHTECSQFPSCQRTSHYYDTYIGVFEFKNYIYFYYTN